jgi:hypothetical protein
MSVKVMLALVAVLMLAGCGLWHDKYYVAHGDHYCPNCPTEPLGLSPPND